MVRFESKTERLGKLARIFPERIEELEKIFNNPTNVYLDYANIQNWSEKLRWHVDIKRLKQFFDSFNTIQFMKLYSGTLKENQNSLHFIKEAEGLDYDVITKEVKKMRLSLDVSGIPKNSPVILENFIKKTLLRQFTLETIEYLNSKLRESNERGIRFIEHWKCNFDVEISCDMILDGERKSVQTFILKYFYSPRLAAFHPNFRKQGFQFLIFKKFVILSAVRTKLKKRLKSKSSKKAKRTPFESP